MALLCTIASSLRLQWDTATSGISQHIICARDFSPISRAVRIAKQSGQVAAFMHILISVSLLAAIIKDIDELRSWRREVAVQSHLPCVYASCTPRCSRSA